MYYQYFSALSAHLSYFEVTPSRSGNAMVNPALLRENAQTCVVILQVVQIRRFTKPDNKLSPAKLPIQAQTS
jgi:hypothetical protein